MAAVRSNLHNGEHTLNPVMVKMIHSAIRDCERAVFDEVMITFNMIDVHIIVLLPLMV
jgi:hypothetical protein